MCHPLHCRGPLGPRPCLSFWSPKAAAHSATAWGCASSKTALGSGGLRELGQCRWLGHTRQARGLAPHTGWLIPPLFLQLCLCRVPFLFRSQTISCRRHGSSAVSSFLQQGTAASEPAVGLDCDPRSPLPSTLSLLPPECGQAALSPRPAGLAGSRLSYCRPERRARCMRDSLKFGPNEFWSESGEFPTVLPCQGS